ncbi:MAG: hypothetical protein INH41_04175 [Myxococcaceae bacterium]|jgi:hypothetical protein|nr:hypothetical protein [Myxococcaceae bacterium]
MDPFVRRLVERLFDPASGLSRNRHFHTFDNPEGRQALALARRLEALADELSACRASGDAPVVSRSPDLPGRVTIVVPRSRLDSTRTAYLSEAEFELLLTLPEARLALGR